MANEVKASTARRKTSSKAEPEKAAAKPVKKVKADSQTAPGKAGVAKPAGKPRKTANKLPITPEVRLRHIEVAAYYIAEKRGFAGGDAAEDWLTAEQQVDHLLLSGKLPT